MTDAGYNYERLREKMEQIGIDPSEIRHILITHQDTDHVGAVERDSDGLHIFGGKTRLFSNKFNVFLAFFSPVKNFFCFLFSGY